MSNQQPIFNGDLLGKANRIVMNGLVQGSAYLNQNRSAIDWARAEMQPPVHDLSTFLAMLTGYQLIADNRWKYSFRRAVLDVQGANIWFDDISNAEDDRSSAFDAINLYELPNTNTSTQDGDLTAPPMTVGPVGTTYDDIAESWSFADPPTAVVIMHKVYAKAGQLKYCFMHPNPVRCLPQE